MQRKEGGRISADNRKKGRTVRGFSSVWKIAPRICGTGDFWGDRNRSVDCGMAVSRYKRKGRKEARMIQKIIVGKRTYYAYNGVVVGSLKEALQLRER